jgi:transcriptional regulator with XRE-family HTH domain
MSKKRPVDEILRSEVANKLEAAIKDNRLSYSEAARLLQVHRQTLWLYLKKKATPGGDILRRACRLWNITLSIKGFQFSEEAFAVPGKQAAETLPQQLSLLDLLQTLREDQLDVKIIGKVGDTFEVKLLIKGATRVSPLGRLRA